MQQLEDRMLGVGAGSAPGDGRRRLIDGRTVHRHRLAVRFHLQLLEVEGQQAQPLVIGEGGARLASEPADVEPVDEGGDERRILRRLGVAEVAVHLRRAFEQFLEGAPAQRQRRGQADSAPQRVAAAYPFAELEDAGLVDPGLERRLGPGSHRDHPAEGIVDAGRPQPVERGVQIGHRLGGGEGLRRGHDQRRRGIERPHGIVEGFPVDVRQEADVEPRTAPAERIDEQRRPEHRTADADVQDARDVAERAGLDRIDQRPHPRPARRRELDGVRRSRSPLGNMLGGPALGRVHDLAREQGIPRGRETPAPRRPRRSGRAAPRRGASSTSRSRSRQAPASSTRACSRRARTRFRAAARRTRRSRPNPPAMRGVIVGALAKTIPA